MDLRLSTLELPTPGSKPQRGWRWALWAVLISPPASLLVTSAWIVAGLPPRSAVRALAKTNPVTTAVMREREAASRGRRQPVTRLESFVPLAQVSSSLIQATVTAEDPNFFFHKGVDWEELKASVRADLRLKTFFRGGSTITQQLAKNLYFTTKKSLVRKIRELIVARWLETDLSKGRILELYLNVIEWGNGVYGCSTASIRYYGKPASQLSEVEAAGLAAMIPSPRLINPETAPRRFAAAQERVLRLMSLRGDVRRIATGFGALPPPELSDDSDSRGEEAVPMPAEPSPSPEPRPEEASPQPTPEKTSPPSPEPSPEASV